MSCMNCCLTEEEKRIIKEKEVITQERKRIREEQIRSDKKIEKQLKEDRRKSRNKVTVLLLGTGESGKSTFLKQLKLIKDKGFSESERKFLIQDIIQNIYISMQSMIAAMKMLQIEYESPNIMDSVELIRDFDFQNVKSLSPSHAFALKALWADEGIQQCFKRSREYQLTDSTEYFQLNIDRIADPKYLPNNEDILRVRVPTTGIIEKKFKFDKIQLTIVDVGGQQSERKKWLSLFEGLKSIIFISALSEYDQTLNELKDKNRLQESIALFGSITTNPFFINQAVILFLNKLDLLEKKIMDSHLADYFPKFQGPQRDAFAAREFIRMEFLEKKTNKRDIYTHYTQATDTENIKLVFKDVKRTIIKINIKKI